MACECVGPLAGYKRKGKVTCKSCKSAKRHNYYMENIIRITYNRLRYKHNKYWPNTDFITYEEFIGLWGGTHCHYCKEVIDSSIPYNKQVDRYDNDKGYGPNGQVVLCHAKCNRQKGDFIPGQLFSTVQVIVQTPALHPLLMDIAAPRYFELCKTLTQERFDMVGSGGVYDAYARTGQEIRYT